MRTWILAVALVIGITGMARAEEVREVEFLNGIYSVEVPTSWWVKEDDNNQGVTVSEKQNSPYRLIISSPLPGISDTAGYAQLVVQAVFKELGGDGKVLAQELEQVGPETYLRVIFNVLRPQGNIDGMLDTIDMNGYTVTMLTLGPDDEKFLDFVKAAEAVSDSYAIDPDKMDEHKDALENIAREKLKYLTAFVGSETGKVDVPIEHEL